MSSQMIPSLSEHSDLLQALTVTLIGFAVYVIRRWDKGHTEALAAVMTDVKKLAGQVELITKDLYELRGEHYAHHHGPLRMRREDAEHDDQGFRNTIALKRNKHEDHE